MITPWTGTAGIEPTPKVLETFFLPLNYVPKNGGKKWIRTTEPEGADLQSAAFSLFAIFPKYKKMPARGLEPPTYWLQVSCSTNWAIEALFNFDIKKWRSRRESNPRSPAWQAGMLTPTPRNHIFGNGG